MARVIGIGCLEGQADPEMIQHVNYVEYSGLKNLLSRIDAIRSLKALDQINPWEILNANDFSLTIPQLAERHSDIIVKENGANTDIRHYDYVSNRSGPARNTTVKFVAYPVVMKPDEDQLSGTELLAAIRSNLEFLIRSLGRDRVLITLPKPQELSPNSDLESLFRDSNSLRQGLEDIGLALALDDLQSWAQHWRMPLQKVSEALSQFRIKKLSLKADQFGLLKDLFQKDRLQALEAVTYIGDQVPEVLQIKKLLHESGATLIDDALSVEYYFPEIGGYKHREIFQGTRYCFQALDRIHRYVHDWMERRLESLTALLDREPNYVEPTVVSATGLIEAGAFVSPSARVGAGSVVKKGAVVMDEAIVEDGAVIGAGVYISQGAHIKGGLVEQNVYIGRGVLIEGNCTIKDGVWIEDRVKEIRNSMIASHCFVGEGTVIYGAAISDGVLLGDHCELRPGTYIRKDTIFGDYVVFRSEAKNTVIMDGVPLRDPQTGEQVVGGSESGHYGYCGDSILGRMVNEGAGDMNSNVKNDWGGARVTVDGWKLSSGLPKFGAIIGDYTTVGCLTVLEPGTLIGRACNVYGAKVRAWLQTATVYAEDQIPRRRWADSLPRERDSLGGRSAAVFRAIKQFEESRTKRITPPT